MGSYIWSSQAQMRAGFLALAVRTAPRPRSKPEVRETVLEVRFTENAVLIEDNSLEVQLGEAQELNQVYTEQKNGLDLSEYAMIREAGFPDTVYLGIAANTERLQAALQYVEYLTGGGQ